jgi:Zn-dependent protease
MTETLHLGRIRGLRIGANWSVLLIFWLIVVGLGAGLLPNDAPGSSGAAYFATAAVVTLAFLACLLAHELAHAIVATRRRMEVEGIVLWALGGVSKFKGDAPDASSELRIAVAGPATSVALAAGFFVSSRLAGIGHPASLPAAALGWLGWMNGLLAAFNLLPAFPLDGGRVLRSMLWHHNGDKLAATRTAARVGEVFGYGFVAIGVVGLFFGGFLFNGLWLAAIGWFLARGARSEADASETFSGLSGVLVRDAMTPYPFTVPELAPVDWLMREGVSLRGLSSFPTIDGYGHFSGLVTRQRIDELPRDRWGATPVVWTALHSSQCVTCGPDDELAPVARRMSAWAGHRAVVLNGGRVVGIVSPSDVQRAAASRAAYPGVLTSA